MRVPNPENPDGFAVIANASGEELALVAPSLANWENPRQLREQFNRRLADISSLVEPVQAKFPEFLGNFVKDDVLALQSDPRQRKQDALVRGQ
jgi:hypothetical protein